MATHIDILNVRRTLSRDLWGAPQTHGPDAWMLVSQPGLPHRSVVITCADDEGVDWIHASMACKDRLPNYLEMCELHRAVWGTNGYAYEVHAPRAQHVNIHENALHLWGRADGKPVLPEFGRFGTI